MTEEKINPILDLYKANTSFFQRLGELVQQVNQQWPNETQRAIADAVSESGDDFRKLLGARDFPTLIALQSSIVLRQCEKRQDAIQAALRSGIECRDELAEALRQWQQNLAEIAGNADNAPHIMDPWIAYLGQFSQFWAKAANAVGIQGKGDGLDK